MTLCPIWLMIFTANWAHVGHSSCKFQQYPSDTICNTTTTKWWVINGSLSSASALKHCVKQAISNALCVNLKTNGATKIFHYFKVLQFGFIFFWICLKELFFFNLAFGQDSRISDFGEPNIFFAPFKNFEWPIVVCRLQRFFFFFLWNVCKQHSMVHKFSAIRVEYSFTTPPSITNPMHKLLP